MSSPARDTINRMLSAFNRILHTQTREEELRTATVKEATKKLELEKILDAERELTKARADNDQLRKAIETVRAERVSSTVPKGQSKKDTTPKRTI